MFAVITATMLAAAPAAEPAGPSSDTTRVVLATLVAATAGGIVGGIVGGASGLAIGFGTEENGCNPWGCDGGVALSAFGLAILGAPVVGAIGATSAAVATWLLCAPSET